LPWTTRTQRWPRRPASRRKAADLLARFVAPQAVQVDLGADGPLAAAQPGDHVGGDAGAAVAQAVVGEQQRLHIHLVGQRLGQRRALVGLALARLGRRQRAPGVGAAMLGQRVHRAHGQGEGLLLRSHGLGPARASASVAGARLGLAPRLAGALLERRAQRLEALERRLHSRPRSAKETVWPRPTTMWSSTRTSTRASADLSVCVRNSSAREGSAVPEGWLWASTTAAALQASASSTTSRG
jgi:hypothetical protein